ncbi:hypothetical protein CP02DC18_1225 [Chlamydia psittaci 02DC18]|nr:hypothetical protein CP02DC18_1225 [Chlamydia psittaci 02DC18]EPJ17570.1 hypothetical protein CP01DC11_1193 [Chlamydia psittaci 01DC11]EPJ19154.1 hypothetical protein CP02DC23_1164 [Chlamydia psittaci 02DC23]EPJ23922.1 hypothetical protein CP09DC77_1193 [Chlamydia psittaci 09DC77]
MSRSKPDSAGLVRFEPVWSGLSLSKPIGTGLGRFESGLSRSKPV